QRGGIDPELLYGSYWRVYDESRQHGGKDDLPWWKQEERRGRIKRPRIDLFLFHYLQYRLGREVNIGHLFQEFRNWWDGLQSAPGAALADMQRYADAFAEWIEPTAPDRIADFNNWLNAIDTSTLYPLMCLILVEAREHLSPTELNGLLDDLESYLVRRAICGLTNKQYNRFFILALQRLRK